MTCRGKTLADNDRYCARASYPFHPCALAQVECASRADVGSFCQLKGGSRWPGFWCVLQPAAPCLLVRASGNSAGAKLPFQRKSGVFPPSSPDTQEPHTLRWQEQRLRDLPCTTVEPSRRRCSHRHTTRKGNKAPRAAPSAIPL